MHSASLRVFMALILTAAVATLGQKTVSAETEVGLYGGLWLPFLPDYQAASIVSNGGGTVLQPDLFNDDLSEVGAQIGIRGLHRLGQTRTMVEFDLNIAGIDGMGSRSTVADPGPTSTVWMANLAGNAFLATANGESATFNLDSDVLNHSQFIGLRDRFDLCDRGIGLLDLGFGFSHMAFDQDHDFVGVFDSGFTGQYLEDVDNDYYGIDIRSSLTRSIRNRSVRLDFNVGIYDLDGSYDGTSLIRNAGGAVVDTSRVIDSISETALTIDVAMRMDATCCGVLVRPGISLKYISDMISINHPQTIVASNPVSIDTEDAFVVGLNVELLL